MNPVLLLVDIQNDYFPGGAMELHESEKAAKRAEDLLLSFRKKKFPVVHVRHVSTRPGSTFFLPGTQCADFRPCVLPEEGETVFVKHFPNSFRETQLLDSLRELNPDRLVIAGMMTHMCVDTTVRAACGMGLTCTLAHDACATRDLSFGGRTVAAQDVQDGRFPTVASPNPENAPALKMAVDQAEAEGADIVIGTDPDCDRMGVAARDARGRMVLLTGNEVGSLLAYYRVRTLVGQGVITDDNRERACLIKTFVTSELQAAIARHYGVNCVNTLTGFKFIAAKLRKYEEALPRELAGDYRDLPAEASRALRLEHSRFLVIASEESYGYLGQDDVRDKDANGAAVMFVEMATYAMSVGLTVPGLLDNVFKDFGYFTEKNHSIYFEGAEGAAKIARLAASYAASPPAAADGAKVVGLRDFNRDTIRDEEGDIVPKEAMLVVDLEDGRSFCVRPSGTEPKIKYYVFGQRLPAPGRAMTDAELAAARSEVDASLASLWQWLEADARTRVGSGAGPARGEQG